ncbi:LytR C-terminal domain-containing protein [Massilia sp. H6]|uniref:LytR C-terminal domain-containing protein n=1 Tax=Massilia sp. H6 TaxID=2970464 RepID=UPI002167B149|nr:LytR C-terminal domain-containing protein [Massilia sp. H6]UVW28930.1 LytR C-terminal domain-containing protein [Massilia sp. H6]
MRITALFSRLSLLCAGASLLACAPFSGRANLDGAAPAAADAYMAGRNHHLARRYDEARAAYLAALQAAPQHVDARNGLATLHAEQRDFATAIALWRALTESLTMASGPGQAYLLSNLGHAYFLNAEYDNALVALEKACLLDPLNHRSWELLGETLRKLGLEERAQQMLSQANALRAHDFRADYAVAKTQTQTKIAAIDRAVKAPARAEQDWSQTELLVGIDGMLELRRGPAPVPMPGPAPALPAPGGRAPAAVEIRNGNGVPGMARSLARQLGTAQWKVTRLSNQQGFGVQRTRVEYEALHRALAEQLAARFGDVTLQEVADCGPAGLRVVIGHDIARRNFALTPPAPVQQGTPAVMVATKPG